MTLPGLVRELDHALGPIAIIMMAGPKSSLRLEYLAFIEAQLSTPS